MVGYCVDVKNVPYRTSIFYIDVELDIESVIRHMKVIFPNNEIDVIAWDIDDSYVSDLTEGSSIHTDILGIPCRTYFYSPKFAEMVGEAVDAWKIRREENFKEVKEFIEYKGHSKTIYVDGYKFEKWRKDFYTPRYNYRISNERTKILGDKLDVNMDGETARLWNEWENGHLTIVMSFKL